VSHIWTQIMDTVAIRHTLRRNEMYHINFRMSDRVYRKSLKTDSPSNARMLVSEIMGYIEKSKRKGIIMDRSDIDEFIEMLISNKLNQVARISKAITEPLSNTANSFFQQWYAQQRGAILDNHYHNTNVTYPSFNEWLSNKLETTAKTDPSVSEFKQYNPDTEEHEYNEEHTFFDDFRDPTIHSAKYDHLDSLVSDAAVRIAKADNNNAPIRTRMELDELHNQFKSLLPQKAPAVDNTLISQPEQLQPTPSILFEDIEDDLINYLKDTKQLSDKYLKNRYAPLQDLITAFRGMPLNYITTADIEERWIKICRMPKLDLKLAQKYHFDVDTTDKSSAVIKQERRTKRWEYIYENDEADLPEIKTEELYSEGQLKNHKTFLEYIFTVAKRNKYIETNPFVEDDISLIIPKNRSNDRTKLPADKAKNIIEHCFNILIHPCSWAVLLMAHQGMRNEEVTGLHSSQIITDSDTNIVYINILKGKTKNSKRKIPVHRELLKHGFLDFVDSKTDCDLFDFDSRKLTQHFNYFREKFDIPNKDKDGNLLNLYSFRHNVVSALSTVSDELKYRLIGHGTGSVTANYTALDLVESQRLINLVKY